MVISDKWKFIFIAVPKTGTTTIERYCQETLEIKRGRQIRDPKLKHTKSQAIGIGEEI